MKNHPRSGGKRKIPPRIDRQIVMMVQKNQFLSTPKESNLLENELGIQVNPIRN